MPVNRDRATRLMEMLNLDGQKVVADSLTISPWGDGWKVEYQAFEMLSATEMALLANQDAVGVMEDKVEQARGRSTLEEFAKPGRQSAGDEA